MAKYRKILVAYDGSSSAQNALRQASRLAREDRSWIKVLTVRPAYEGDLELIGVSSIKETIAGSGQKLLAEVKEIADRENVHILTNLEQGEPYDRIVHIADEENCDLIIMGRRGVNRLERGLIGSVTARVIGHTTRDVLVIPAEATIDWSSVLLATDGSPYSAAAVKKACSISKERGAELTAVSVIYTNDEFSALAPKAINELINQASILLDDIRKQADAEGIAFHAVVKEGEPYEAIKALADEISASLIVMGSHGRKGLTKLLMGSVTERVIGLAACPVLVSHITES